MKFYIIACDVIRKEICHYASKSGNTFEFNFLKQGLHETPDMLRNELQKAIDDVKGDYDAILIGYGLCSNGIVDITARDKKLVFMRGHDCITFLLGSKERYREYFDKNPGTYWYSPGWIDTGTQPGKERYETTLKTYIQKYGIDNAEYLMKMEQDWFNKYNNAAYIDFGFDDTENLKEYTKQCAQYLKWKCDILKGNPKLIMDFLEGRWDKENFLVLNPGEKVMASHDDKIVKGQ